MEKKKAVIYARYSSHNQREESIEGQLRVCHQYAERSGYQIIKEYTDSAVSGRTDNRPAFQQMMDDAPKKRFEVILVYKLDRFARDRYVSATYKNRLKKHGVRVESAMESISDGAEGVLMESILEGFAEYYSVSLAENVKRGMEENALHCKSNGGNIPLGYTIKDGQYTLDPINAKAVQMVYDMYEAGVKQADIVRELNDRGFKTTRGREFKPNSLWRILSNKKYTGTYCFNGHEVPGAIPVIIEQEQFDRVQKLIKSNRNGRNRAVERYLLSGKLFCGECGKPMVGMCGTSASGQVYRYYACDGKRHKTTDCKKANEKKETLEDTVLQYICETVLTDEVIHEIAKKAYALMDEAYQDKSALAMYEQQYKDNAGKMENILKAIESGRCSDALLDRLEALENEKADLECKIVAEKLKKPEFTQDHIEFWLRSFKDGKIDDPDYQKSLTDVLLNSVFVYDKKEGNDKRIVIALNLKNSPTDTLTSSDVSLLVDHSESKANIIFKKYIACFNIDFQ